MAKAQVRLPVIDSHGKFGHRKRAWIERHEAAGHGAWRDDGVFVFQRHGTMTNASVPGARTVGLLDRLRAQPDAREFPIDINYWDGRGVLKFWADQSSPSGLRVKL